MSDAVEQINTFIEYANTLAGKEKSEAQVFCDRLFQAFGHGGYKEAGAELEDRVARKGRSPGFVDLIWKPRLLLEMKSSDQNLQRHYQQAFDYWVVSVPHRPRYVVLCNFVEFWIYDFDIQLHEPVEKVATKDLADRYTAFNFLFAEDPEPQFGNNRVSVTREAANSVARVFNAMILRGEDRERAQKFILQSLVAMFSEDFNLLPRGMFTHLLNESLQNRPNSYDLIGALFAQMNSPKRARGGRFTDVPYFNGGLFEKVEPIELTKEELILLLDAANERWDQVAPPIFGTLFQESMDKDYRHAEGAHFTHEADIQKIIQPSIVRPWRERIQSAKTLNELAQLNNELMSYRVLDPSCGSGNFLYIAYREIVSLNMEILVKIYDNFSEKSIRRVGSQSIPNAANFYGIDRDPFAVELAKVTLMLSKRIAVAEIEDVWFDKFRTLPFDFDEPLPLDNLDKSIICEDALFVDWPEVDCIVGNPPFQSKNKMLEEFGREYVDNVRALFPGVSGRTDYCVYWFRRAHESLKESGRAGLVGTNTIRQTYSRESGLDYILANNGTITEAVSTQVWSGDAVVNVSIVNWINGPDKSEKKLFFQHGDNLDSPWSVHSLPFINSSLSLSVDVSKAKNIKVNSRSKSCFQGQTHGSSGFLLENDILDEITRDTASRTVVYPYLIGDDILGQIDSSPTRHIIDLNNCADVTVAKRHKAAFKHLFENVLPFVLEKADEEKKNIGDLKKPTPRQNHAKKWWRYWRSRDQMISTISKLSRYIACSRTTRRPIFEFVSSDIRPNDALQVFAFDDDYSFGILQSSAHCQWFEERCSTLKRDPRYTSSTVYDSFVWPQNIDTDGAIAVAEASSKLRNVRRSIIQKSSSCLRDVYRDLEIPGNHVLKNIQDELDDAVRNAYGMKSEDELLQFLFELNQWAFKREQSGKDVTGPGVPNGVDKSKVVISHDCVVSS